MVMGVSERRLSLRKWL